MGNQPWCEPERLVEGLDGDEPIPGSGDVVDGGEQHDLWDRAPGERAGDRSARLELFGDQRLDRRVEVAGGQRMEVGAPPLEPHDRAARLDLVGPGEVQQPLEGGVNQLVRVEQAGHCKEDRPADLGELGRASGQEELIDLSANRRGRSRIGRPGEEGLTPLAGGAVGRPRDIERGGDRRAGTPQGRDSRRVELLVGRLEVLEQPQAEARHCRLIEPAGLGRVNEPGAQDAVARA